MSDIASTSPDTGIRWRPASQRAAVTMPNSPLSHHEILALVEPFARRGRHVDLAASNRLERWIVFKPVVHPAAAPELAGMQDTLRLDHVDAGTWRLTRTSTHPCGLQATLATEGADPGELLARIDTVAPHEQFLGSADGVVACRHRLQPFPGAVPADGPAGRLLLEGCEARVEGLALSLTMPTAARSPAEIEVRPNEGEQLRLPEDLFAVLGWDFGARLGPAQYGWRTTLALRGGEPERSRRAEARMQQAVVHLARTLSDAPRRFHERFAATRWAVAFRRSLPLLTGAALIALAACLPYFNITQESSIRMLIFNAPPVLLILVFCMREIPRIEVPPLPRASKASSWRVPPDA